MRLNRTKRDLEADFSHPNPMNLAPLDFAVFDADANAAKDAIAAHVRSPAFAAYVQNGRQGMASHPVAVMPQDLAQALGSQSRIVRLSGATLEKQRRRHPDITDYSLVQTVVDYGNVRHQQAGRKEFVYADNNKKRWRLIIKTTELGDENYLLSWHRLPKRK